MPTTMRSFIVAITALLVATSSASTSFQKDVVRRVHARKGKVQKQRQVNDALLEKAVPVADFEKKHGVSLGRQLEDYEMDYNDMYSFSGYSLTYAKCQPVQYFSSDAVEMGSYSPMITEDIVVMRLCPTNSCSDSKEYGCYYNYAEFAIELQDYMGIMLRYASQTTEYMCEYCEQCLNGGDNRNLEEGEDEEQDAEQEDSAQDEDGAQDEEGDDADQQDEKDADGEQGDNGEEDYDGDVDQGDDYYQYACSGWDTYCSDYSSLCVDDENEDGYLDFDGYLDYIECTQVNYNDNNYFIMPRCDGYNNKIKMVAHYDAYCTQASGNDVNIKNFGLGMRDGAFQEFYSGECIDCSESNYPPYDATSTMCNRVHYKSAQCLSSLEFDAFDDDESDDTTECSYIESIRTGTYDETGAIALKSFGFASEEVTTAQKLFLSLFVAVAVGLTVYACYLHHAMTNLLIKSLSHRELLPPSRHASRRNSPRRSGRRLKKVGADSDWDENEYA